MTLTVRLPEPLERKLDAYCTEHGLTKTHVVQECLAQYLVNASPAPAARTRKVSENFATLKKLGLVGIASGMNGESATKEVVRRKVLESIKGRRR